MQQQRIWQKYTTLTRSNLLTATVLVEPSFAADTNQTQIQGEYLLAQASENSRQVIARNGLNVRRQPTANSEAIGLINSARNVTIQSLVSGLGSNYSPDTRLRIWWFSRSV